MDVRTDARRNRIYITHTGKIEDDEATDASSRVIAGIEELQPGFAVVNDMTEYRPQSQAVKAEIAKVKRAIDESDAGTVVRVAPESTIANMQMDRAGDTDYVVEVTNSLDEAEALLDAKSN